MAVFYVFNHTPGRLAKKLENWNTDSFKFMLSNTPIDPFWTEPAEITEISGGGYVPGGYDLITVSEYEENGQWGILAENLLISPVGADWEFQYVVATNDTTGFLSGWWDLEFPLTVAAGDELLLKPDAVFGALGTRGPFPSVAP